jgi:hypothetical protein
VDSQSTFTAFRRNSLLFAGQTRDNVVAVDTFDSRNDGKGNSSDDGPPVLHHGFEDEE